MKFTKCSLSEVNEHRKRHGLPELEMSLSSDRILPKKRLSRRDYCLRKKPPQWMQDKELLSKIKVLEHELDQARAKNKRLVNSFFNSDSWRNLRYRALKEYGRICALCRKTEGVMHVDHIKPRSKFPELALVFENLQILCDECNLGKSNLDDTDFRGES